MLSLAGCSVAGGANQASSDSPPAVPSSAADNAITLYVFGASQGVMGPDGNGHAAIVPSNFVLHEGQQVTVTVFNYSEGPHSITSEELGLDLSINPVMTTFQFTPTKKGVFRWHCVPPCDPRHSGWAMTQGWDGPGQPGYMAGNIIVV
jgi:hypothetical protein